MAGLTDADRAALGRAVAHATAFRDGIEARAIAPRIGATEALARVQGPLPDRGVPAPQAIDELAALAEGGLMGMASPGFFGFVLGASDPTGVAADWMVSAWGQNAGYAATTPATAAIERTVCAWALDLLGLPPGAGAGLVTGGTVANAVGVLAARNALLAREGWDVEARGLFGAPEIHVAIGEQAHSAAFAALRLAGLGSARVHKIPADADCAMDEGAAREVIGALDGPVLVMAQAGQINSGAFDPFGTVVGAAREKGAWVHVDGAFGLWLAAVPELRPRLAGVEGADSWAVDLHKWLNAPFDAGLAIVRDRAALVGAMSAHGAYLPAHGEVWDPSDSAPELSRRARGVPSWAILRSLGRDGVREMVRRHCRLAVRVAEGVRAIPGLAVLNRVVANQVAIAAEAPGEEGHRLTRALLAAVQARGRSWPSHGEWRGRAILRVSVIGHRTTEAHVDALLEDIRECWTALCP